MVFPLWGMGKQFLIGLALGIFSLLPFFPLALHTMYDLVIFCHPKEAEDGGESESQIGVIPNMEIDFGGEDNTAYVTNVTHGEDMANPSNMQALKYNNDTESLAQLEGINFELLVPNLESMNHGIKELEVVRFGSDKGSLEEFNAKSNIGVPGIKESSVKLATFQCIVISTVEIEEQPTNVRTWMIWHRRNALRISDKPVPILQVLQDAQFAQASYVYSIPPKPPDSGSLADQHTGWIASMADSVSLPFSVEITMTVWTKWTHRNRVRTNHPCCSPNQLANMAKELLTEF
uniref:Uncharacterized protein n=1 Tax=Quercus lobata TaxID=97700 RepID=A0A7N2LLT6_QUELO